MSRVWVRMVSPTNLHGFRANQLKLDELDEGLNVVYASNASGKSTLAKAIVNLFQPEYLDQDATINGVIWNGDEFLSLAKRRKEAKFGGFPGRTKDYFLDLPSLLQGLKNDAYVQELLAKGFKFTEPSRQTSIDNSKEVKAAREALINLKQARRAKQSLLQEEQRLPELADLVSDAERAKSNVTSLEALQDYLGLNQNYLALNSTFAAHKHDYPGIELQNSERVGELDRASKNLKRLRAEKSELILRLRSIGPDTPPKKALAEVDRVRLQSIVEELRRLRVLIEKGQLELEGNNESAVREARRLFDLAPDQILDDLPNLTEQDFQDIAKVAELADEDRSRSTRIEALKQASLDTKADLQGSTEQFEVIQRSLLNWLQFEPQPARASLIWQPVAVLFLACALGFPLPNLFVRGAILIAGLGLSVFLLARLRSQPEANRPSLMGVPTDLLPMEVNVFSVVQLLNRVTTKLAQRQVSDRIQIMIRSLDDPSDDWREIAENLGLGIQDPYRLRVLSEAICSYVQSCRKVETVRQSLEDQLERERSLLQEAREIYLDYGYQVAAERELESFGDFLNWFATTSQLEVKSEETEDEILGLNRLLDDQGIPEGDLAARIEDFFQRLPSSRELEKLRLEMSMIKARMDSNLPSLSRGRSLLNLSEDVAVEDIPIEQVEIEIIRQNELAAQLDARRSEHQDLLVRVRQAESSKSIERLESEYRSGLSTIENRWEAACERAVKYRVSEAIRQRLMTEDLPPVLQTANNRLFEFSLGRYRLEFARTPDDLLGALTVNDLLDGKKLIFSKLSSGTKVHVLLALRLALVEEQEKLTSGGQLKFPLLVDEAMALSDPESTKAIAQSLLAIATERQVIVFTSQESDVVLLQSMVPDLVVKSLNQTLEIPEPVESGLERTLIAPLVHKFDPRIPIGAHSIGAIFGQSAQSGGRRIDQSRLDAKSSAIVKGLERTRRELTALYPRLNWGDCTGQRWAQTAFAPRIQEFLDTCAGCPHRFLKALEASRSIAFNRIQVESALQFLDDNGYLVPPITDAELFEILVRNLEGQNRDCWENVMKTFAEAFIPDFDGSEWSIAVALSTETGLRPFGKRPKRLDRAVTEAGLFDDVVSLAKETSS